MTTSYEDAIQALYRAPQEAFVAERKRLAGELKQAGDKAGASVLSKHTRPSVSAWVVNQLWWQARAEVEELFATGARVRAGNLGEAPAHRRATAELVTRAAKLLEDAGHGKSEATLRRVSANLAALAAKGDFAPDPPGALRGDRDPPGFDAMGLESLLESSAGADAGKSASSAASNAAVEAPAPTRSREDVAAERARAKAEAAEKERVAEEQARLRRERQKLAGAVRDAKLQVDNLALERDRRQRALEESNAELERAQGSLAELEARLAELGSTE